MRGVAAPRTVGSGRTRRAGGAHHAAAGARADGPCARSDAPCRVAAWLTATEWARVGRALGPRTTLVPCATLADLGAVLADGAAHAALVSAARFGAAGDAGAAALGRVVRAHPGAVVVGLVTGPGEGGGGDEFAAGFVAEFAGGRNADADPACPGTRAAAGAVPAAGGVSAPGGLATATLVDAAFRLGRAGVAALADTTRPGGWAALRRALAPEASLDAFARACVARVLADVGPDASPGLGAFLAAAFAPGVSGARCVAARLGVPAPTLHSRFRRRGLPSAKRYVDAARLVRAARLGEASGAHVADVASQVGASSAAQFRRTVRRLTGRSAGAFCRGSTGAAAFDDFRAALVLPVRDALRGFDPTARARERPACDRPT